MVEFHVDNIPEINVIDNKTENKLHTKIEEECCHGGNLSIHKEPDDFEYGYDQGKEGYWTYDHMAVQFEDCVDCIKTLFPQFDSIWQFDHSCGHDIG
jgi:hypothetical protein